MSNKLSCKALVTLFSLVLGDIVILKKGKEVRVRFLKILRRISGCLGAWLLVQFAFASAENVKLTGNFVQGGMVSGSVNPGDKVFLNDQELRVSDRGDFVVGFDRDAQSSDMLIVRRASGQEIKRPLVVEKRQYDIQRIEGIAKRIMQPSTVDLKRIKKENGAVRKARQQDLASLHFIQAFKWPIIGPVTGVFGSQRVYNGEPRRPHYGVDVAAPVGTLVRAPAAGLVTLAHDDMFYSGGTLIIDHGHGISSSFLHLSKILVKAGDAVKQGDLIAKVGKTGRATGPHLDWRMNWFKRRIDPQLLVPPMESAGSGDVGDGHVKKMN